MKPLQSIFIAILVSITQSAFSQNTVLWEITGNGLQSPSYMMGTLKFIGENEFTMPPVAVEKLGNCKIFAIEDPVDHHAQHELNAAVHFPDGQSLKTALTPGQYDSVRNFFVKEFKISGEKFDGHYSKLIPLALSVTMTRLSLGEKVRFYDIELLKIAKDKKLETYSLENIEREAEALHQFPMEAQVKALLHSVANFEVQKEEFKKLMAMYPQGDLKQMFAYSLHPADNNADFIDAFYTKRNLEWLPKLEKMVHEKPSFIAVGISHLEGENGLLNLLKSKGFTLTPIAVSR